MFSTEFFVEFFNWIFQDFLNFSPEHFNPGWDFIPKMYIIISWKLWQKEIYEIWIDFLLLSFFYWMIIYMENIQSLLKIHEKTPLRLGKNSFVGYGLRIELKKSRIFYRKMFELMNFNEKFYWLIFFIFQSLKTIFNLKQIVTAILVLQSLSSSINVHFLDCKTQLQKIATFLQLNKTFLHAKHETLCSENEFHGISLD